jgi:acetolactate synthase small subunit
LICKLLQRIVPVHASAELTRSEGYIERELALVQIIGDKKNLNCALEALEDFRFNILDTESDSTVIEIIGNSNEIEDSLKILEKFGLATVSRTGIAAGFKGKKRLY